MSSRKSLSLFKEEKLTEQVRNYLVIYDKSHKGYMERDVVLNVSQVSETIRLTEVLPILNDKVSDC